MLPTDEETPQELFDRLLGETPKVIAELNCPDCGQPLKLKLSKYGRFYGCTTYKKTGCKGSVSALDDGTPRGEPVPTGSKEKKRRRQIMQQRNPPTRWQRLLELDKTFVHELDSDDYIGARADD